MNVKDMSNAAYTKNHWTLGAISHAKGSSSRLEAPQITRVCILQFTGKCSPDARHIEDLI